MKRKASILALIVALLPGWILPRIAGTILFLAHPTLLGAVGLFAWWVIVPSVFVLIYLLKKRYGSHTQP